MAFQALVYRSHIQAPLPCYHLSDFSHCIVYCQSSPSLHRTFQTLKCQPVKDVFYNLNGVRICAPAKNGIVICKPANGKVIIMIRIEGSHLCTIILEIMKSLWRMKNDRLLYIDKLKALAMLLAVWGHTIYFCMYHEQANMSDSLLSIICTFHVPLFFFLSGVVIANHTFLDRQLLLIGNSTIDIYIYTSSSASSIWSSSRLRAFLSRWQSPLRLLSLLSTVRYSQAGMSNS